MEDRSDTRRWLVIADPIYSIEDLDPPGRTPAGHEGARYRRVEEIDYQRVVHDASCTRWG